MLSRDLYNGAQLQEPFTLTVSQSGINDIVARLKWPREIDGISISVPLVIFETNIIALRGLISSAGLKLLVTASGTAFINEEGLLNLNVTNVKVGALNVTVFAKALSSEV